MKVKPLGRDFELNYDDSRHKYDLDSRLLHGASTIAGMVGETQWMIPWASGAVAKEADKVLDELGTDEILRKEYFRRIRWAHKAVSQGALDIGNSVHEWAEKFVNFKMGKAKKPAVPKNAIIKAAVMPFVEWVKDNDIEFLGSEEIIYYSGDRYDFAGTSDIRFIKDGELCIGDFKTTKNYKGKWAKREMVFQCGLYGLAVEQSLATTVDRLVLLRLPKIEGEEFDVIDFKFSDILRDACRELNNIRHLSFDIAHWLNNS